MTKNAVSPVQGMPLPSVAPYIEFKPVPPPRRQSVPSNLSTKSHPAQMPQPHPELAGLSGTPDSRMVPVNAVRSTLLVRDRLHRSETVNTSLASQIKNDGLLHPIIVQEMPDGLELVAGARRLAAYKFLCAQGQGRAWNMIPATVLPPGTKIAELYHRMIAENLRSKSLSYAEMAVVAMSFAADPDTADISVEAAIAQLYRKTSLSTRATVREFARLLDFIGAALRYPDCLTQTLCSALTAKILLDSGTTRAIKTALAANQDRTSDVEQQILWRCVDDRDSTKLANSE